jgi:hypothetical protein
VATSLKITEMSHFNENHVKIDCGKSYTLIPHRLQDYNVQSCQKSSFPLLPIF